MCRTQRQQQRANWTIKFSPRRSRGQEKHDENDKGDEDLTGGEARDGMRHSARRRVLFEPAGQFIFGLEIKQRHAQRFQLLHHEPFDLPLDCSRRFAKPQFELRRNYCELGKASFGQSSLPEEIAQLNEA